LTAGPPTLLASAALALGTAVGFAIVGRSVASRAAPAGGGRGALAMFQLFWASAFAVWTTQGLASLAGGLGFASLAFNSALDQVSSPFYCLAAASLLYYVLYLVTGRERLLLPILVYYGVMWLLLRWRVEFAQRLDVKVNAWSVGFVYATPLQGWPYTLVILGISGPLLLAILGYASLWFHVEQPLVRYRIALVTLGLVGWVGTESLVFALGLADTAAGELTRRAVALASTIVIFLAYKPPDAWRMRLDRAHPVEA